MKHLEGQFEHSMFTNGSHNKTTPSNDQDTEQYTYTFK